MPASSSMATKLEVADGPGFLHELSGLPDVRGRARGVDECADLALAADEGGEHRVAGLAGGGQGLPGQRRLVHFDRVAVEEPCIGGHDVAEAQADDVARYDLTRWWGDPLAVPYDTGPDGQLGLQGGDGLSRLALLPKVLAVAREQGRTRPIAPSSDGSGRSSPISPGSHSDRRLRERTATTRSCWLPLLTTPESEGCSRT